MTSNKQVALLLAGAQQLQPLLDLGSFDLDEALRDVADLEQDPEPGHGDRVRVGRVGEAGEQQGRNSGKLTVSQN